MFVEVVELDGAGEADRQHVGPRCPTPRPTDSRRTQEPGLKAAPSTGDGSNWRRRPTPVHRPTTRRSPTTATAVTRRAPRASGGAPQPGSSGGWVDWIDGPVRLRRHKGRSGSTSRSPRTRPASGSGSGSTIRSSSSTARRSTRRPSRTASGDWTAGPAARGTYESQEKRLAQSSETSFIEGGVVATDDSVYTGFGFEGMNAAARPEFMRRVMAHLLGVTGKPGVAGPATPGTPGSPGGIRPARSGAGSGSSRSGSAGSTARAGSRCG